MKNIQSQQLHKALLFLSDDERDLIDRLFFREQTEREVAAEYGLSQKAINKRRQKVLAKLREQLKNLKRNFVFLVLKLLSQRGSK